MQDLRPRRQVLLDVVDFLAGQFRLSVLAALFRAVGGRLRGCRFFAVPAMTASIRT
ncbi:MAG: hypothetical protein H0W24_03985 [Lysobacter sp.]|nr:hypothetical protein [Lysobacter sp.]